VTAAIAPPTADALLFGLRRSLTPRREWALPRQQQFVPVRGIRLFHGNHVVHEDRSYIAYIKERSCQGICCAWSLDPN
jgi:hypothetical protein